VWELKLNYDVFQEDRKDRIAVSRDACQWVLKKKEYKDFIELDHNTVLFFEAGPGFGKSALAKFLTMVLAQEPGSSLISLPLSGRENASPGSQTNPMQPVITEYFSKKEGQDNSPKAILMHILYQLF
jgi:hypothetical protein